MVNRLLIMLSICLLPVGASAFEFARDGKALCRIAVASNAGRLEKMAADDLRSLLGKAAGTEFAIVSEKQAGQLKGPVIYLGSTEYARKKGFPVSSFRQEEWLIREDGRNLIITGGHPVGAFYGVWSLLNKLGIYALTLDQLAVPRRKDLRITDLNERKMPAFIGRIIYTDIPGGQMRAKMPKEMEHRLNLFFLRSGLNGQESFRTVPYHIGECNLRPKALNAKYSHTLCFYVSPKKYFKTHPEYFAMNPEGRRYSPPPPYFAKGSLCMSNREVWRITLDSLRKMILEDRHDRKPGEWPVRYDISVLDNTPYICKCPECSRIAAEEESECGLLLRYLNYVATEIVKEYPDVKIKTSAYSAARKRPKITRPVKNLVIHVADEFPTADPFRPLTHPLNAANLAQLRGWAEIAHELSIGDYWNIGGRYYNPPRVEVMLDALQPDFRLFRKLGVADIFTEYERDFVSPQTFYDLHLFLGSRLMMDPDQDVESLIDVFMKYYYGSAAPVMREWLEQIRSGVRKQPNRQTILTAGRWNYMTGSFAADSYLKLKKAAESFPEGNIYRIRIQEEMITVIWASLYRRLEFEPAFKKAGIDMDSLIPECRKYVVSYMHRYQARDLGFIYRRFDDKFKRISLTVPRPARFKAVPDENIRVLGYPHASPIRSLKSEIVNDPD